jgi:hypothetical protein
MQGATQVSGKSENSAMKRKIVLYFLLFTCSSMTAEAVEVRLKSQASAAGPLVLLGDVADIQNAEKNLKQKLQQIELFPSPASGQTRLARVQEIRELVELQGTDPGTVSWSGSQQVRVRTAAVPAAPASERKTPAESASSDSRCLQQATLVRRGEAVTVCSRAQGVCVRTMAKALEDGGRDELIMLESLENKNRFSARIVGPQEAEVRATGFHLPRIASTPAPPTPIVKK